MKKYVVLALVTLAAGVGAGWASAHVPLWSGWERFVTDGGPSGPVDELAEDPSDQPKLLVVNGEVFMFGEMLVGGTQSHAFQIKNVGTAPLTLTLEETTCKCTISDLRSATLQPGEAKDVTLEWKPENFTPTFTQSAVIRTNDPRREVLRLEVKGVVEEAARVVPPTLRFSNIPGDQGAERAVRIYATKRAAGMQITGVDKGSGPLADHLEYEVRELAPEQLREEPRAVSGYELVMHLKPGMPTGVLDGQVRVQLSTPEQPEVVVPVSGNVIADISVLGRGAPFNSQRNLLQLGPVKKEDGARAELVVLIKGERREQVEIEIAGVDPANVLRATLGEKKKTDKLVTIPLTIEVLPGSPTLSRLGGDAGPAGRVLLRARNSLTEEIPIEVRFTVN